MKGEEEMHTSVLANAKAALSSALPVRIARFATAAVVSPNSAVTVAIAGARTCRVYRFNEQ